jgi:PST family polysaccharide transporter
MQVVNFAVPLMLLPFLTRQLGMEGFGQVAVVLAAIQVAYVLTDYGFSFSATYAISLNRDDRGYINKKIGAIFAVKALLLIPTCLALLSAAYLISTFNAYFDYFVIAIIAVIAQAFLPIWLFQGLERMRNVALYTVGTKVLS